MTNILYTIFIFPIEQIIELSYVFIYRIFDNPALSVLGVSLAVSIFTLPLYFMAERHQQTERDIQKKMKGAVDNIRSVFSGDERFMLLSTYYRQNGYHPLYSLRTSVSLIIQIPFFIAAYHFLSNLEMIKGVPFGPIKDLAKPDSLFMIGGFSLNVLPVLMTIINIISSFIYAKGLSFKENIQLYGMAAIFLLLLYNSPAGLVLYWTGNNLFSLVKNMLQKTKHAPKIIYAILFILLAPVCIFVLFFHKGLFIKRLILFLAALFILLLPLFKIIITKIIESIKFKVKILPEFSEFNSRKNIFIFSLIGIFLLIGLVIPTTLISSSVNEFSFLDPFSSPFPYIMLTILQCLGYSLLIIFIYLLFDNKVKTILTILLTVLFGILLANTLTFTKEYGIMTPDLSFERFSVLSAKDMILNMLLLLFTGTVTLVLIFLRKKIILISLQIILIITLLTSGLFNIIGINKDFVNEPPLKNSNAGKIFTLSKTGKNVIVIIIDRAVSGYFPHVIEEKPELIDSFKGFVYYPNTTAPGRFSLHGLPSVFGGYYYTPYKIHNRTNELQMDKIREAIQILPRIFEDNNYFVFTEHLPYVKTNVFENNKNITEGYNNKAYSGSFIKEFNIEVFDYYKLLYKNLIRFAFFKASPVIFHEFVYDNGDYLSITSTIKKFPKHTIDNYSFLYNLPNITETTNENTNYALIIYNELTHAPAFLELPDYTPSNNITNKKEGLFSDEDNYYVNMASYLLLAKWFDYLKENEIYNNTRIIIASDHGNNLIKPLPNDIKLPNNRWLRYFNSMLMVKDFDSEFELKTDYSFMTNSDVPHIAADGLIEKLTNPFTEKELLPDKDNGYIVTSSMDYRLQTMQANRYNIKDNEWLIVRDNVFDPSNWSLYTP